MGLASELGTPVPLPHLSKGVWWQSRHCKDAAKAFGFAPPAFKQQLGDEWDKRHSLFVHESLPKIKNKCPSRPCWKAGMCVCSGNGELADLFRYRLQQWLKTSFPKKTSLREKVDAGLVVFCLRRGDRDMADVDTSAQHWLHVALMYHRPARPTFLRLQVCDRYEPPGVTPLFPCFTGDGEPVVLGLHEMIFALPLLHIWVMEAYELLPATVDPHDDMVPGHVAARLLGDLGNFEVWKGSEFHSAEIAQAKARKGRRGRPAGRGKGRGRGRGRGGGPVRCGKKE